MLFVKVALFLTVVSQISKAEEFGLVPFLTKLTFGQIGDVMTTSISELNELNLSIEDFVTERITSVTNFFDAFTESSFNSINRLAADTKAVGCAVVNQKEAIQNIANETLQSIEEYSQNKIREASNEIEVFVKHVNDSEEFTRGLEQQVSKCISRNAACLFDVVTMGAESVENIFDELKRNVGNATEIINSLKDEIVNFSAEITAKSIDKITTFTRELMNCLKNKV